MSFNAKHIEIGMADLKQDLPTLSRDELLFLLNIIREVKFEGKDVEHLYNLILKLQSIYIALDKQEQLENKK
jgi:hypothetical protein